VSPIKTKRPVGKPPSTASTVGLAAGAILLLAGLFALAITAQKGLPGLPYYNVTAQFRDAKNLTRFADVRMAGKRVGQVREVKSRHGIAQVQLQLQPGTTPLRDDTTARIRLKGLLGAKYVELTAGTHGKPMPNGGTIPMKRTSTTVELFDVLDSLDAKRRASLGRTVRGLGQGFYHRGDELNQSVQDSPPLFRDMIRVADAVAARPGAAERFFPSLESAAAAYDPVREDAGRGFDPGARSLRPFVDRRPSVQAALEVAPSAFDTLRDGLTRNDPLLQETARWAVSVRRLTRPAPAALMHDSPGPLRTSRTLLANAASAVRPTIRFTDRIDPLISPSIRSLRNSTPGFRELGRRGCDFIPFARNWRSMLGFGLETDHPIGSANFFRLTFVSNEEAVADTGQKSHEGKNRYPNPCVSGTERLLP
jgi:virulence factor Mce-like protein